MKRHVRRRWLLASVLILGALIVIFQRHDIPLLVRSTRIVDDLPRGAQTFWLSDREMLLIRRGNLYHGATATRLDVVTKSERPLFDLDRALRGFQPGGEALLSPDGKWLLWNGKRSGKTHGWPFGIVQVTTLAGSDPLERPPGDGDVWMPDTSDKIAWQRDSAGWVRFLTVANSAHVQLHEPRTPHMTDLTVAGIRETAVPATARWTRGATYATLAPSQALGMTRSDHLLVANVLGAPVLDRIYFNDLDWHASGASRSYSVPLPAGARVCALKLSPQGDRLAWAIERWRSPAPWTMQLARYLPILGVRQRPFVSLSVTDVNGGHWRDVGTQEVTAEMGLSQEILVQLRWTPDGKRLSFVCCGTLYAVPAD